MIATSFPIDVVYMEFAPDAIGVLVFLKILHMNLKNIVKSDDYGWTNTATITKEKELKGRRTKLFHFNKKADAAHGRIQGTKRKENEES